MTSRLFPTLALIGSSVKTQKDSLNACNDSTEKISMLQNDQSQIRTKTFVSNADSEQHIRRQKEEEMKKWILEFTSRDLALASATRGIAALSINLNEIGPYAIPVSSLFSKSSSSRISQGEEPETQRTRVGDISRDLCTLSALLASDLTALSLRTGLPLTILKLEYLRYQNRQKRRNHSERLALTPHLHSGRISAISTVPQRQSLRITPNSCLTGEINGLPNFGHTCFFNSVIQALASLTPVVRYVERIADIRNDDWEMQHKSSSLMSASGLSSFLTSQSKPPTLLTKLVHEILQHVNSDPTLPQTDVRQNIRKIFHHVGEKYAQFRNSGSGNEQQDAQELLQALLGLIIGESLLLDDDQRREDEEILRSSISTHRTHPTERDANRQRENGYSISMESSLFSLEELESDETIAGSYMQKEGEEGILILEEEPELDSDRGVRVDTNDSLENVGLICSGKEEKKQEEAEDMAHLSSFAPEEEDGDIDNNILHQECNLLEDDKNASETFSDQRQKLSTSIQMMIRSLSSKTPSPLSGCIGSTLQCCECKHTSTTRDTPFLEIPIVPTNISSAYKSNGNVITGETGPTTIKAAINSCRLVECLKEFTSKERIHDVNCRACPIGAELQELEEEEKIFRDAIDSISSRHKAGAEEPYDLRQSLDFIKERKSLLIKFDPDAEEVDGSEGCQQYSEKKSFLEADPHLKTIPAPRRVDAIKHLFLTRLPPVLCLHVKRLFFDPTTGRMAKSAQHIDFPEYLDLSSMYSSDIKRDKSPLVQATDEQRDSMKSIIPYKLMSVIEHRGHAYAGHYLTYRRVVDNICEDYDRKADGKDWVIVSDEKVSYISWDDVRKSQAYMLLYEAI